MEIEEKKSQPLKLWISGVKTPLSFENSGEAIKQLGKKFDQVTSGSIEIVEKLSITDGSTLSSQSSAGLRNWAIKELDNCAAANTNLSFFDVKYKPEEQYWDKNTGENRVSPSRLIFRRSMSRE